MLLFSKDPPAVRFTLQSSPMKVHAAARACEGFGQRDIGSVIDVDHVFDRFSVERLSLPVQPCQELPQPPERRRCRGDRKSTRLNSSHGYISYAVFCLKKKKRIRRTLHA